MSDYTPTTEAIRGRIIQRGIGCGFYGLEEFDRWLTAHDAEKRAEWEAEQGETEYIVRDHYGGLWTLTSSLDEARHYVLREPGTVMEQRKVTPWLPVPGSTVRESDSGVRDSDNEESEGKA